MWTRPSRGLNSYYCDLCLRASPTGTYTSGAVSEAFASLGARLSFAPMATVRRVAPILPVRDLNASLDHYERLGFSTRKYLDAGYGFAERDGVEIHLGVSKEFPPSGRGHSIYLFVDDAGGVPCRGVKVKRA